MDTITRLKRQVAAERERHQATRIDPSAYPADPVAYTHNVLGVQYLWPVMAEAMRSLYHPPYRTLIRAGHGVGKSFCAAAASNHFYDSHEHCAVITTAPDMRSVNDILWKEIRTQRLRAGIAKDLLPKAAEMRSSPTHYAKGITAASGEGFQGRHDLKMLFVFDEAVGIDQVFWETVSTMFKPQLGHAWLAIFNPTDTTSQAYQECQKTLPDGSPAWHQFTLSCLDHPNIAAHIAGESLPVPAAVSYDQVDGWVRDWCDPIPTEDRTADDIEWPPASGQWWKPGPVFEARVLGRWPTGVGMLWPEALWQLINSAIMPAPLPDDMPQIGCDVARFGDDYTSIHVRWGNASRHHESHNGWDVVKIADRLEELANEWAAKVTASRGLGAAPVKVTAIMIKPEDDGVGGGVTDILRKRGLWVVPIQAASKSTNGKYPNKRSELYFQVRDRARMGQLSIAMLPQEVRKRLWQQASVVEWAMDAAGRRVIEPKDSIKEKLGRSPDDLEAMNAAYLEGVGIEVPKVLESGPAAKPIWQMEGRERRGAFPFGRG